MNKPRRLPSQFWKFFWEVDLNELDINEKSEYVITRLLKLGGFDALSWLQDIYGVERIRECVKSTRDLSNKYINFYSQIYEIPKKEIKCLREVFQQRPNNY